MSILFFLKLGNQKYYKIRINLMLLIVVTLIFKFGVNFNAINLGSFSCKKKKNWVHSHIQIWVQF
jgi:hypothetical protein